MFLTAAGILIISRPAVTMAAIHAGGKARAGDRAGFYGMDQKNKWPGSQPGPGIQPGAVTRKGEAMTIRAGRSPNERR